MTTPGRAVLREYAPPPASITAANVNSLADAGGDVQLSPSLGAELLDLDAWAEILTAYGRTMRLAVALTDADGHVLGKCQNAQPVWTLVRDAGLSLQDSELSCSDAIVPTCHPYLLLSV
jgi:hypothetical protein